MQWARAQMKVTEQYRGHRNILKPISKNIFLKGTCLFRSRGKKNLLFFWNNTGKIQLRISAKGAAPCTSWQSLNCLAAHWAMWFSVGNARTNRWPHLAAVHSGHPGSLHQPHPESPTWSPSWRRTTQLKGGGVLLLMWVTKCWGPTYLKMVLVLAKLKIGPRTTPIPRSSDAFNCIWETPNLVCNGEEMRPHKLLTQNCGAPLKPWSWTLCPCTAAWHRLEWWRFSLFRGGRRTRDVGACPRW